MTGRISIAFSSAANVLQLIADNKLTALAVAQPKRSAMIPDLPTIDEAGLPGVDSSIWLGMLAPAGLSREIVETLSKAVNEALRTDDIVRQMRLQGLEPLGGSPDEFARRIKDDTARWDAVLQAAGLAK